jgi:hypothetical protein
VAKSEMSTRARDCATSDSSELELLRFGEVKILQAGHTGYESGKARLQYGLVRGVKNELVRLNSNARVNAVAPGCMSLHLNSLYRHKYANDCWCL